MLNKKWLIVLAVFAVLGFAAVAALCVVLFFVQPQFVKSGFPVYTTRQVPSTHPGYLRTLLLSGSSVYVNDYEEYPLRLLNPEPTQAIGIYGASKVCAIPGQSPANYIAADCGSEMPAYEVFRNTQAPPFDWRTATFQQMQFTGTSTAGVNLLTTNQALITDLIRTLRDATPAATSQPMSTNAGNFAGLNLSSDQLPGMVFCPAVYLDLAGKIYVAGSLPLSPTLSPLPNQTQWKSASQQFTDWVHSH